MSRRNSEKEVSYRTHHFSYDKHGVTCHQADYLEETTTEGGDFTPLGFMNCRKTEVRTVRTHRWFEKDGKCYKRK